MQDALALFESGQLDVAADACRAALTRDLDDAAALHLLGRILLRQGNAAEAVPMLATAAEHCADASLLNELGEALHAIGLHHEAEARFRAALAVQPDAITPAYNLALLWLQRDDADAALPLLQTVVARQPDFPEAWLSLGNIFLNRDNIIDADTCFRSAIAARPDFVEALSNLGNALVAQHRLEEAARCYDTALTLRPDNPGTEFAHALGLLLGGNLADGWRHFEARRRYDPLRWNYDRRPELPQWQPGDSLTGKRVLLLAEQGGGDVIQFARYATVVAEHAAEVVLEVPHGMRGLFSHLPGVARVVAWDEPVPDCDIAVPLLSLPLCCGTGLESIPAAVPYAEAPPERLAQWQTWLRPLRGRRIGLVCSGRPGHPLDRQRSIPLARLAPILAAPDCAFVLLQPELRAPDQAALADFPSACWPGAWLRDYADTAALLQCVELLITVDTSVAHLAGALGRPVWLMLPFAPDFRWLLGRGDSPWYPTMRLYRQPARGDWDSVIAAVRRELDDLR